MIDRSDVIAYNAELKSALTEMWAAIPRGQQKKILREHPLVGALMDRFKISQEVEA